MAEFVIFRVVKFPNVMYNVDTLNG